MREIKFRAWTANTWVAEQWNIKMIYDYQDTTLTEVYGFNSEELPVMQFTGLKDKNGKEIYENDVVIGNNRIFENALSRYKVTYLNGCFMFGNWNAHEYFNKHQNIEIIGNIYEHSHLLDK